MSGHTIRVDPHVHTSASYDASGSIRETLSQAHNSDLDAVAITDHDTTVASREALELAGGYDITVVPGVEITTDGGHLLALGVLDHPPIGHPFPETVDWVRDRGGLAIVPHPFQVTRHGVRKRDLSECDGIEVFNAWAMTGIQNRRARAYASAYDHPPIGASDAHEPAMIGRGYTEIVSQEIRGEPTADEVLDAFRSGPTRAVGQQITTRKYLGKYTKAMGRQVLERVR